MTFRRTFLTCLSVAALTGGAAAVSGCGSSSTIDPVAQAAVKTQQLPGVRMRFTEQITSSSLPQAITLTGSGFVNQRQGSGQLDFDFSNIPGISALSKGSKTARMVFQFPVMYIRFDFLSSRLPGHKPWIKVDLQKATQAAGINLSQLTASGSPDPSQYLSYLRSVGNVTKVGTGVINGQSMTQYRAVMQLSKLADRLPPSLRAAAQAGVQQLEKVAGTDSIPVVVWVDSQGRVRREQIALHLNVSGAGTLTSLITVDFTSFGPTPQVTAPPADQVFDATSAAAAGVKAATGK